MEYLSPLTWPRGALIASVALFLGSTIVAVHRLYFHPLSAFPGPKLAAITVLYEAYYDVCKGGKYIFKVNELHKKYGKIPLFSSRLIALSDACGST